jgi:eukaryotic-like serine/threonine-protein kinase
VIVRLARAVTEGRVVGGRYALLDVLGSGGMATVWRATDQVLGREVAVKLLSPQLAADRAFRHRFEREAKHVAALSHPALVTVFDCGTDGTTPFIVMELVAGQTLRQILDEDGALAPDDAIMIAAAVCEALEAVHEAGLVHRDIKPANIVLSAAGVKVLDFGISRLEGTAGGTRTQAVLGTAAYLAPEVASGEQAGPRSDLYALGCVLFEMLTGRPPFTADADVAVAYRHVHDDPGPPSALRPGLPGQLDWATTQLLAKDPAARPADAAAARASLLAALTPGRTAVLPPQTGLTPNEPVPPARPTRRPTRPELVLGALLIACLAGLVAAAVDTGGGAPASPPASHPARQPSVANHPSSSEPPSTPSPGPSRLGRTGGAKGPYPPIATAAGRFVAVLQAGLASGQVSQQAGQNMFNQLSQLLFEPPGQNQQQLQQRYDQLVQEYDQYRTSNQISGQSAVQLGYALSLLRRAIGAR